MTKIFTDYRSSETGRPSRSPSILAETMDEILQINSKIDWFRREFFDQTRKLAEEAKDRQVISLLLLADRSTSPLLLRRTFDRRSATIEINSKRPNENSIRPSRVGRGACPSSTGEKERLSTRFDREENRFKPNYGEKTAELESECNQCLMNQNSAYDQYLTSVYRAAASEYSISKDYFLQYLIVQGEFYRQVSQIFQEEIPHLEKKYSSYPFAPVFQCDLYEHCSKRVQSPIAYPLEVTIHFLKDSLDEEGLFRQGPSLLKQKKLVAQLDLQLFNLNKPLTTPIPDPHVSANVLKQYLRDLPDPLLTNALFPYWNQLATLTYPRRRL